MEYLQLYNKAKTALAEACSVDELSAIIDQTEIIRYAAKIAKDYEMEQNAYELRLRAERKFGEISSNLDKDKSFRGNQYQPKLTPFTLPTKEKTLESVGVSKVMASKFEKLAEIPEEKFEQAISDFRKEGELSRAKLLRITEDIAPKPKEPEYKKPQTIFINVDDPIEALLNNILNTAIRYRDAGRLHEIIDYLKISISNHQKSKLS